VFIVLHEKLRPGAQDKIRKGLGDPRRRGRQGRWI
jgi:hypothetical protein